MYVWENSYMQKVLAARSQELKALRLVGIFYALQSIMFSGIPLFLALASFGAYTAIAPVDQPLTATRVFVSLSLFQLLNMPIAIMCTCHQVFGSLTLRYG